MSNSALLILLKGQACIQDTQLKGNLSFTDSHNLNRHIELHVHGCEVMTQKSLVHYAIRSSRLWEHETTSEGRSQDVSGGSKHNPH